MTCSRYVICGLTMLSVLWVGSAGPAVFAQEASDAVQADSSQLQAKELERQATVRLKYWLYLPKDYDTQEKWPLMLFLHGAGERGDNLELVKKHGPPKLIDGGKEMPFIVVAPQCPGGRWWEAYELAALLDEIEENHKVDRQRIYVTGLSMGGFGTWSLAAYQPNRFAAIVPICGGGEPFTTRLYAHLPTWVFHGDQDNVVPLARSESMVEGLKRANGNVKFTVYPEVGHDSWTETYNNHQLYQWMLEHTNEK